MGRIISVTSGKGGVGKTMTTVSLAFAAKQSGYKVLIVDGDLGLSNVDVVLGLTPKGTLKDVLDGTLPVSEIITRSEHGFDVISSGSGISQLANMTPLVRSFLIHELKLLPDQYDFVFLDTGAGISDAVLSLNSVSDLMLVVTTPEPHAITDAYAVIKLMGEEYDIHDCSLIVNQSTSDVEARRTFERIRDVAQKFCGVNVRYLGGVQSDQGLTRNILARRVIGPHSSSTLCGQGWTHSWWKILEVFNSPNFTQRSQGLMSLWQGLESPPESRQKLDL